MFTSIKDYIIRKLSTSLVLRYLDGYKTQIARGIQAANLLMTAAYVLAPLIDQYAGTRIAASLDGANAQLGLLTSWLAGQGFYEFGKADAAAKARLESK
jgi:hypothetical protein